MRTLRCAAIFVSALFAESSVAHAEALVDLELVLAADVSNSMDREVGLLQRSGYAAAFRSEELQTAISGGEGIAVTYIEWGDAGQVFVVLPWTLLRTPNDAEDFADRLEAKRIRNLTKTAIGHALSFAGAQFEANDFVGLRRVVDISGNGPNNQGPRVDLVRDELVARGITINGLPILTDGDMPRGVFDTGFDLRRLGQYYRNCVVGGPGAFVMAVTKQDDFFVAARRKLIFEIAGTGPPHHETGIILAQFEPIPNRRPEDCS